MPFIVEDGTIVAGANALASVEFADDYFALRNVTAWAELSIAVKQASLVTATDYIQVRYGSRFLGTIADQEQSLSFPRVYQRGSDPVMPDALLKAACEYAIRASVSPLAPDPVLGADGRLPTRVVEEIGPIREEYAYSDTSTTPLPFRAYPAADALIALLIRPRDGVYRA
jgi:hypothetical protein